MHRRYLFCSVSRCTALPRSFKSNSPPPRHPTPPKTVTRKKKKELKVNEPFKLRPIANHQFRDVKPLAPERKPARKSKLPENFFPTARATSYKLLRNSLSPEKITGQGLKAMLERHEARAMILNQPKTSDPLDLGLSDEAYQGVSFAPGTFIEARRSVSTSNKNFLAFIHLPFVSLNSETK